MNLQECRDNVFRLASLVVREDSNVVKVFWNGTDVRVLRVMPKVKRIEEMSITQYGYGCDTMSLDPKDKWTSMVYLADNLWYWSHHGNGDPSNNEPFTESYLELAGREE